VLARDVEAARVGGVRYHSTSGTPAR